MPTLAALISGLVGGQSTPRPPIAPKVPAGSPPESRVQRCASGLDTARLVEERDGFPSAESFWTPRACETRVWGRAGRGGGRGGVALRIPVRSQGRALPLAWRVRPGPQGQVPAALHSAVVEWSSAGLPAGAQGVVRGDGACDGTARPATLHAGGWADACRTALRPVAPWEGEPCRLETLGAWSKPGTLIEVQEVQWTRDASGPVLGWSGWAKGEHEPRYGVSHRDAAEEACRSDPKRFGIATLCSDQQSRGFHRHTAQRSDPQR